MEVDPMDTVPDPDRLAKAAQAERALLGMVLIDPTLAPRLRALPAGIFQRDAWNLVREAIHRLADQGLDPDVVTVQTELDAMGQLQAVGGAAALVGLVEDATSALLWSDYATQALTAYQQRALAGLARRIARDTEDGQPPTSVMAGAVADLTALEAEARPQADWEPPIPLEARVAPPFPLEVFPAWAADMAEATAQSVQVDIALTGGLVLAALAAVSMKRAEVLIPNGYVEPLNLFVVPVLPSGERKTGAFRPIMAPIYDVEDEEGARWAPIVQAAQDHRAELEALIKRLRVRVGAVKATHREAVRLELRQAEADLHALPRSVVPELTLDDVTAESLGQFLVHQAERAAILSDEPTVFENLLSRYTPDTLPSLKILLAGYDGGRTKVKRIGRASEFLRAPLITLGLCIQPGAASEVVVNRIARDRGLPARCLFLVPRQQRGRRQGPASPVPPAIARRYHQTLAELGRAQFRELAQRTAQGGEVPRLPVTGAAAARWAGFFAETEADMRDGRRFEELADWASKVQGAAWRIAGLLHLADAPTQAPERRPPIPAEVMERAIQVTRCLLGHGTIAFGLLDADPVVLGARRVLGWIGRAGLRRCSLRQVQHDVGGTLTRRDAAEPVIKLLVDLGYLRPVTPLRTGRGRPPSPQFAVNPLIGRTSVEYVEGFPMTLHPHHSDDATSRGVTGEEPDPE
jgi:Protein of unknown function (DUF3987)/DnaB-like helicase N terminal domain